MVSLKPNRPTVVGVKMKRLNDCAEAAEKNQNNTHSLAYDPTDTNPVEKKVESHSLTLSMGERRYWNIKCLLQFISGDYV